jgi:hypothetical protein
MDTTTYHVLRTITEDGTRLTHLPTAQRIAATFTDDYPAALRAARELRTDVYQHNKTGEVRVLNETQINGCAYTDEALFHWLGNATILHSGGYAFPVDQADLVHYEPATR